MSSGTVLGSIPLANTFLDDPKNRKKKNAKKVKREKLDKQKSKPKDQHNLKDYADIYDSTLFAQWQEMRKKKKKRKRKHDAILNEEFLMTQNKNPKLAKKHKQNRNSNRAVEHGVRSGPGEQQPVSSSIQKEKKHKKRVVFNLSPILLEPKPIQSPFRVEDLLQPQSSRMDKKPPFNAIIPADGRRSKPATRQPEDNGIESQSTSDDINSQDLFITQKTFSDAYIDLCSSTSTEEAQEPQLSKKICPEHRCHVAPSSAMNQSSPEPQSYKASCPKHQSVPDKKLSFFPAYHPSPPTIRPHHHKLDTSTQTENFFTSHVLATSLRFRHRITCTEEPLDLSLPKRSWVHQQEVVGKASEASSAADQTQSDDSDSHLKSKADLSQLKVVQTRLNESFFFRLKREGDSPKPRSPLMKLAGSAEKKKP